MARVLVPVADGTEEIEAVTIVDTLRRAGDDVVVAAAGADSLTVTASRGVRLVAERPLAGCEDEDWDLVAVPGGKAGAERLAAAPELAALLRRHFAAGRPVAAICAAPALVLAPLGLLAGRRATCHPDFAGRLAGGADPGRVVEDGQLITSRGPGTALEFALALAARLHGADTARRIGAAMVVPEQVLDWLGGR